MSLMDVEDLSEVAPEPAPRPPKANGHGRSHPSLLLAKAISRVSYLHIEIAHRLTLFGPCMSKAL
jgi:hypothetical protein